MRTPVRLSGYQQLHDWLWNHDLYMWRLWLKREKQGDVIAGDGICCHVLSARYMGSFEREPLISSIER